jgi:ADP-ribose pyrophosphatase YjhB (NUDIX family)
MSLKPYIKNTIVARGLVINSEGKILLVSESGKNWHMPGGMLDELEEASKSCEREVLEETGLKIQALDIFYVYQGLSDSRERFGNFLSLLTLYFTTKIINNEVLDLNWKDPDGNLIQHRKFFDLTEIIDSQDVGKYTNNVLKYIQKAGISNLISIPFEYGNSSKMQKQDILKICN